MVYSMKIKGFLWFIQLIHIIHVVSIWFTHQKSESFRLSTVAYSLADIDFIIHMWPIYQIYVLYELTMTKNTHTHTHTSPISECIARSLYVSAFCYYRFVSSTAQRVTCAHHHCKLDVCGTNSKCLWLKFDTFHFRATKNQHYLYK